MSVETNWDYLFYSYKATLPLTGKYRSDFDLLHHAVNLVVKSELKEKQKQGALEELTLIKNYLCVLPNRHFKEYLRSVLINRIKELKEGV